MFMNYFLSKMTKQRKMYRKLTWMPYEKIYKYMGNYKIISKKEKVEA